MNKTTKILQVGGILAFAVSVSAINAYLTRPRYSLASGNIVDQRARG